MCYARGRARRRAGALRVTGRYKACIRAKPRSLSLRRMPLGQRRVSKIKSALAIAVIDKGFFESAPLCAAVQAHLATGLTGLTGLFPPLAYIKMEPALFPCDWKQTR